MKKCFKPRLIPFVLISIYTLISSCEKEYTCHCITFNSSSSSGFEGDIKVKSKKSGEAACTSKNTSSGSSTTECVLK
jgi:hypothetical protein